MGISTSHNEKLNEASLRCVLTDTDSFSHMTNTPPAADIEEGLPDSYFLLAVFVL